MAAGVNLKNESRAIPVCGLTFSFTLSHLPLRGQAPDRSSSLTGGNFLNWQAESLNQQAESGQSHERFLEAKFAVRFASTGLNGSGWPLSPR
jgi:hypothetical protein